MRRNRWISLGIATCGLVLAAGASLSIAPAGAASTRTRSAGDGAGSGRTQRRPQSHRRRARPRQRPRPYRIPCRRPSPLPSPHCRTKSVARCCRVRTRRRARMRRASLLPLPTRPRRSMCARSRSGRAPTPAAAVPRRRWGSNQPGGLATPMSPSRRRTTPIGLLNLAATAFGLTSGQSGPTAQNGAVNADAPVSICSVNVGLAANTSSSCDTSRGRAGPPHSRARWSRRCPSPCAT